MSREMILGEEWYVCTKCKKPYRPFRYDRTIPYGMYENEYDNMFYCSDRMECQKRCNIKREISRTRRFQP